MLIGGLAGRAARGLSRRPTRPIRGAGRVEAVTPADGTEFHGYQRIGRPTGAACYFARPYHSRGRGRNGDADGLTRQYLCPRA